jgi:hypothetical protein
MNLYADLKYETTGRKHKGNNLRYLSGQTLLDKASKPQAGKAKVDQWDYEKITSLCTVKKQSRGRDNLKNGRKLSILSDPSDRGFVYKIYIQNYMNSTALRQKIQLKMGHCPE